MVRARECIVVDGNRSPLDDDDETTIYQIVQHGLRAKAAHPDLPVFIRHEDVMLEVSKGSSERILLDSFGYKKRGGAQRFASTVTRTIRCSQ